MGDPADRRELLGPQGSAAGGHHHLLVPTEQRTRLRQIRDLGEPLPQIVELRLAHERETYMRRAGRCRDKATADLAGRREGSEDDPSLRLSGIERRRRTGSVSTVGRARARQGMSMGTRTFVSLEQLQIGQHQFAARTVISRRRRWAVPFVIGGRALAASSRSEADGCRRRSSAISTRCSGSASSPTALIASTC